MTHSKVDIELEASLLKSMAIQKNYDQFIKVLDTKKLIPVTATLLNDYKKYYEKHNEDINWETFYTEFTQNWHKKDLDAQDITYYRETVFPLIRNSEIGNNLMVSLLERQATVSILETIDGGFNPQKIEEILESLKSQSQIYQKDNDDEIFKLTSLDLNVLDCSNGLSWFLPSLQAGINSHMPGQFVVLAADSGAGKSAFCISQAVHVFRQLHNRGESRPILYLTSEDTKEDLAARFLSNLYADKGVGFEQVIEQYERIEKHYTKNYNDELFIGMQIRGPSDMYKLRTKIDKYNPCVIIIDMLDKLSPSDTIQDLTKVYQDIRAIANDGYPILGTSQTGNTTYQDRESGQYKHRKWLTDKDLAGSKSGKQGAAYCMIMIGMDDDMPSIRYLSTTKKKRGQNVRVTCQLTEVNSLYKELL